MRERLAFLQSPRSYPPPATRVRCVETHFAWVFLVGQHAYKLKKPVSQGRMDYRTVARRRTGCRNELRLNRRLAPGVYLGIVPLCRTGAGTLALGSGPTPVDGLVKRRRLPASRMLDRLLPRHAATRSDAERISRRLSEFFRNARPQPLNARTYLARLRARTRQTERELHALRGADRTRLRRVCRAQIEFIARQRDLLGYRGLHVVEGHGDLRPEHIFVGSASEPCSVIDCLEFDADLRRLDPAEELAFLALECTRLGDAKTAQRLLAGYRRMLPDAVPDAVVCFYMSQCALVRAQIAAWHLEDPEFRTQQGIWRRRARSYLLDAARCIRLATAAVKSSPTGAADALG